MDYVRHCHALTQQTCSLWSRRGRNETPPPQRYTTAALRHRSDDDGVAQRSFGATTDTRPVNTAEYERLWARRVGHRRTEALGHTTLGKIGRHETIGYAARCGGDTRASHKTPKSLRALYCRLLRGRPLDDDRSRSSSRSMCSCSRLLRRHGGRFRSHVLCPGRRRASVHMEG